MGESISIRGLWSDGFTIIRRGWRALAIAQVVFKIVAVMLLAPLGVAVLNAMLGDSASIGNVALARFALSPIGVIAIVLLPTIVLAELLIEQALMIALAHDACDRARPRITDAMALLLWRVPRLVGMALLQVVIALAIVLPFVGLAALVYWLMLSGADINFYLANRPPIFIAAVVIGAVLALAAALMLIGFYIRVFLAVPIVLFEDVSARAALRESATLSKGRRHEVAWAAVAWIAIRIVVVTIGLLLLRRLIGLILAHSGGNLLTTMWLVAGLIVFAVGVIAVAAAIDRVALAAMITLLYRRLSDPSAGIHVETAPAPHGRRRPLVLAAVALAALIITATHTFVLVEKFTERHRVTVTAHRAGAIKAPENSLAALRLAIADRADAAEIDVQRSSDGVVMVIHDRDLMRLAGAPLVVSTSTAAQLKSADIGKLKSSDFTGERLATLEEFIDAARGKIRLEVELKYYGRGDPELAKSVVDVLRAKDFVGQASIISLEYSSLAQTRQLEPRLPVGFLVSASLGDLTKLDLDFLSVSMSRFTPKLRRAADARNLPIAVWTVNDRESMIRMMARGADELVTDDPALAVATVNWYRELSDVELILLRFREWMAK